MPNIGDVLFTIRTGIPVRVIAIEGDSVKVEHAAGASRGYTSRYHYEEMGDYLTRLVIR